MFFLERFCVILSVFKCCGVLRSIAGCYGVWRNVAERCRVFLSVEEYFLVCPTVPIVS